MKLEFTVLELDILYSLLCALRSNERGCSSTPGVLLFSTSCYSYTLSGLEGIRDRYGLLWSQFLFGRTLWGWCGEESLSDFLYKAVNLDGFITILKAEKVNNKKMFSDIVEGLNKLRSDENYVPKWKKEIPRRFREVEQTEGISSDYRRVLDRPKLKNTGERRGRKRG